MMKRWARRWFTLDGWEERMGARRYRRQHDRAMAAWLASDRRREIDECGHLDRRPNVEATGVREPNVAEICNACGTGIVRLRNARA